MIIDSFNESIDHVSDTGAVCKEHLTLEHDNFFFFLRMSSSAGEVLAL